MACFPGGRSGRYDVICARNAGVVFRVCFIEIFSLLFVYIVRRSRSPL